MSSQTLGALNLAVQQQAREAFLQRQNAISFLFDLWHETKDRAALRILLMVINSESTELIQ